MGWGEEEWTWGKRGGRGGFGGEVEHICWLLLCMIRGRLWLYSYQERAHGDELAGGFRTIYFSRSMPYHTIQQAVGRLCSQPSSTRSAFLRLGEFPYGCMDVHGGEMLRFSSLDVFFWGGGFQRVFFVEFLVFLLRLLHPFPSPYIPHYAIFPNANPPIKST